MMEMTREEFREMFGNYPPRGAREVRLFLNGDYCADYLLIDQEPAEREIEQLEKLYSLNG